MPRAINNVASRRRRKKILARARGFKHGRSRLFRTAKDAVTKALQYSYRDRRKRKGAFRRLWIARINAGVRAHGYRSYSRFIHALKVADIQLDRKVLADLAATDSNAIGYLIEKIEA